MRILEVRDSFIKIETDEKISLSSFLQINDLEKSYIAQVIQTKRTEEGIMAFAKILFLYDGMLKNYDKSVPNKSAEISEFTFDIMNQSLNYTTPIAAGKFIDGSIDILIDKECFNKKILIAVDTPKINNRILSNLVKQFSYLGKVLTIDMLGIVEGQKYVAGVDFKLPLNTESLNFMYEDCLNDATSDSKSLIKEIFNDLAEYSKTVPFLPFDTLKSIIDDMVDKQHVFKLLVLKNKLAKFAQQGYFAINAKETQNLNKILEEPNVIIDLSKLDTIFQNRYLETIYSQLQDTQVFLEASNALNKKNIKNILENSNIPSVFITHSKFKYINEIKSMFDNFIIEPTSTNSEIFKIYSTFLKSMAKDTYLLAGEGSNYIPFVSTLEAVVNIPAAKIEKEIEEPIVEFEDELLKEEIVEPEKETELEITETKIETAAAAEEEEEEEEEDHNNGDNEELSEELLEEEIIHQEENTENITEPLEDIAAEPDIIIEDIIDQKADDLINRIEDDHIQDEISEQNNIFEDEGDDTILDETIPEEIELDNTLEDVDVLEIATPTEDETEIIQENIAIEEDTSTQEGFTAEEFLEEKEEETVEFSEEFHTNLDETQTIEIPEAISDLAEELNIEEPTETEVEINISENMDNSPSEETNIDNDYIEPQEQLDIDEAEQEVIPLAEDDQELDEIIELDVSELDDLEDDTILVEMDEEENNETLDEELDKQIVEDVDKVFTTIRDDSISDSDLDFIDELNSEDQPEELEEISADETLEELPAEFADDLEEDSILEPIEAQPIEEYKEEEQSEEILETRNTKTPIVPVYDADIPQEDMVLSDPIEQGDNVIHAKYGSGTVEKMIKYGTKTLFSINFDNVGRRLLDPTLTEIKKA